jgi:hypothetical protein
LKKEILSDDFKKRKIFYRKFSTSHHYTQLKKHETGETRITQVGNKKFIHFDTETSIDEAA